MKKLNLLLIVFSLSFAIQAQTPGVIVKNAGTGAAILDPDGDGYVSQKTNGTQIGFTNPPNSDVLQSEIPYVPIVTYDPIDDLEQGRACFFSELVGDASPAQYAAMMYWNAANAAMLYRIRICAYIENSKGYSILIDTDQKFGFMGSNADPNALPGNPGFEIELSMMTNHGVAIYDVDGTLSPKLIDLKPYSNYCQKSVAISTYCNDPDYFIDFYLPISDLNYFGVTQSTPMRFAIITNMNPDPVIGSNSLSDVGGDCAGNSIDAKMICVIESQTPTPPTAINEGIEERSICPPINAVYESTTDITGTTVEADGTSIQVFVYESDGITLLGTGTTTSSAGTWAVSVSAISPSVTLTAGQIIKATATAPGKGTSSDDCDEEVVDNCISYTKPPLDQEINIIGGDKGYEVTINRPAGTKIYLYNSDGTLFNVGLLKAGSQNPITTTTKPATVKFECQTGQCFERAAGSSVYRFKFEEPGLCESYEYLSCDYTTGASSIPTINTTPITENTTLISGTGNSANAEIMLYINGVLKDAQIVTGTGPYNFSFTVSNLSIGDTIKIIQIETEKCYSSPATIPVTRQAYYPNIETPYCNVAYPITTITGTSVENPGTIITAYKLNPSRTTLGTSIVQANGTWSLAGLSLNAGDQITAAVTSGTNLTPSIDGDTVIFTNQTDISAYTITINAVTEAQTSVSGTISGGSYPITLKLYADSTALIGSTTVNAAGNWTVLGIPSYDIATGSTLSIAITEVGKCESIQTATEIIVQCNYPNAVSISSSASYFCDGAYGYITVHNSQLGVYYEPVLATDSSTFGYGKMGNGGDLLLTTYQITDTVNVSVKGAKLPIGLCTNFVANNIVFTPGLRPVPPLAATIQYFCSTGTLADMVVNVPAGTSIKWYNASTGGAELPTSTSLIDGISYYVEAICDTNYCTSTIRTMVTAENGNPLPPQANATQTTCYESTLEDINANPTGPGTMVWYSTASGGTPLPIDTPLETGSTYYVETVNGTCTSTTRTAVTITLGMVTDTTRWTGAVSNEWTDDANWTDQHPTVCTHVVIPDPGNGILYPIISGPAACKSITFEPGGGVLGLQHLTYERAYVQLLTKREIWYTITAPLKEMYSGDYFYNGSPESLMKLFNTPSPDAIGPNITYTGTFTRSFVSLGVPLVPGLAYAYSVSPKTWNYPNGFYLAYTDQFVSFPRTKADGSLVTDYVPYSGFSGIPYEFMKTTVTKDSYLAYRFAMEDENNVLQDVKVPIQPGLNFVGNPMMCHLDFNALYATNSSIIANKVKFWNGSTFTTYMGGSGISSSLDLTSTSIAPMQAFFVEGITTDSMLIDLDSHFIIDYTAKLRKAKTNSNVLHIQTNNGIKESSTAVALSTDASNKYGDDDAFKLFSQYTNVPEVYTLAEEMALDINQFDELPYTAPIGLKSTTKGKVTFTFVGAESFKGINVTLMNTLTGEQQNLKTNNQYELEYDGTNTDGYLFVDFRNPKSKQNMEDNESCEGFRCIQVYQKSKNQIGIISPESDKIKNISVWEQCGNLLYSKYNINKSMIDVNIHAANQTCVVRVATQNNNYVVKLIMKQ